MTINGWNLLMRFLDIFDRESNKLLNYLLQDSDYM